MDLLKLKKQTDTKGIVHIYMIVKCVQGLAFPEEIANRVHTVLNNHFDNIGGVNIYYCGELKQFKHFKEVVAKFKAKASGNKPIYRNYCTSEEEQRKVMMFCNTAESSLTSWNTAISAIGKYGIIIKITLKDESNIPVTIQER